MPEFDDVTQPPHYRPQLDYNPVSVIDRYTVLLKDGETTATIYPIHDVNELPPGLLAFLCDEFNMEIERGDTFPFFDTLHIETFQNYWFGSFTAVMVLGDLPTLQGARQWEKECLGTFFIKPNYPGRCLHICTAGFLVNAGIRGKGIGRTLADCYLQWAPRLGYTYSIFNLVFETNVAARRIWESLNFKRVGRVKSAGILKGQDTAVDAIMYGRELINNSDPAIGAYRFDKIKFYLETGKYPAMADRQEKSRLRSSASHYRLENGKLMLNGREVVSDPVKQIQICNDVHMTNHGGINKTTATITEKYHWTRIKDTVATAIKNCPECRDPNKSQPVLKRGIVHPLHNISKKGGHLNGHHPLLRKNGSSSVVNGVNKLGSSAGMRRNDSEEVEAMVAAAQQLHNLPARHDTAESLLTHDLSGLDDGIIAAVEAAQRSHQQEQHQHQHHHQDDQQQQQQQQLQDPSSAQSLQQHHSHHAHTQPHQTYASVAAAAVQDTPYDQYDEDFSTHEDYGTGATHSPNRVIKRKPNNNNNNNNIPVDPAVTGFDDHNHDEGGEEMEIARALIHANEATDDNSGTNVDGKPELSNNRDDDETNIFFKENQE